MTHEVLIITVRRDSRFKLDKEALEAALKSLELEIIRVERARWT